jgi:hypothetical protein
MEIRSWTPNKKINTGVESVKSSLFNGDGGQNLKIINIGSPDQFTASNVLKQGRKSQIKPIMQLLRSRQLPDVL